MSPDPPADRGMAEPLSVSCPACGTVNELSPEAPPVGHRLVCSACGAALVATQPGANGAAADVLWRLFRFADRATINPTCPHCQRRNPGLLVPANDRWGWHVHGDGDQVDGDDPVLPVPCCHCGGAFWVEWEAAPEGWPPPPPGADDAGQA